MEVILPRLGRNSFTRSYTCASCIRRLQRISRPHPRIQNNPRTRDLHTSGPLSNSLQETDQAQPVGDFYADLLSSPIPKSSKASTSRTESSLPTFARSGDATKDERARRLFGDMQGSGYSRRTSDTPDASWWTINGVPVPPRPEEPDNCCMSGCMHCVWDDYRDEIEIWAKRVHKAQTKSHGRSTIESPKISDQRPEVAEASSSMDDDGGGSEGLWQTSSIIPGDDEDLFAAIPVGIREFMATEKRIRDRKKARKRKHRVEVEDE